MALAAMVVVALVALAVAGIMRWGAFEALVRVGRPHGIYWPGLRAHDPYA